jgi:hypothetical protein
MTDRNNARLDPLGHPDAIHEIADLRIHAEVAGVRADAFRVNDSSN